MYVVFRFESHHKLKSNFQAEPIFRLGEPGEQIRAGCFYFNLAMNAFAERPMVTQATLSFEARCRDFMRQYDVTLDSFTAIALLEGSGIGRTKLGNAIRGRENLTPEVATRLEPLLADLKKLCAALSPVRPNFTNGMEVKSYLDLFRTGQLRIKSEIESTLHQ